MLFYRSRPELHAEVSGWPSIIRYIQCSEKLLDLFPLKLVVLNFSVNPKVLVPFLTHSIMEIWHSHIPRWMTPEQYSQSFDCGLSKIPNFNQGYWIEWGFYSSKFLHSFIKQTNNFIFWYFFYQVQRCLGNLFYLPLKMLLVAYEMVLNILFS